MFDGFKKGSDELTVHKKIVTVLTSKPSAAIGQGKDSLAAGAIRADTPAQSCHSPTSALVNLLDHIVATRNYLTIAAFTICLSSTWCWFLFFLQCEYE